jgi:hypothetical protein
MILPGVPDSIVAKILYYLLLLVIFFICSVFVNKFPGNFVVLFLFGIGFFATIIIGVFFTRINLIQPSLPDSVAFYAALQIGLAHALVSLSVLWLVGNSIYLTCILIGGVFANLVNGFFGVLGRLFRMNFEKASSFVRGLLGIVLVIVLYAGIPYGWYLLMVGNPRLQMFLFGHHDPMLGWNLPTTFAFSILMQQVQAQVETLRNDPVFGVFIIQLGAFIAVASKAGGVLGAIQKFREIMQKRKPTTAN